MTVDQPIHTHTLLAPKPNQTQPPVADFGLAIKMDAHDTHVSEFQVGLVGRWLVGWLVG
jgi:hypothetical protein